MEGKQALRAAAGYVEVELPGAEEETEATGKPPSGGAVATANVAMEVKQALVAAAGYVEGELPGAEEAEPTGGAAI
jgi:hypothetical protein